MQPAQVLALYASFAGDRLTFLYSGSFHDEHTARLIALQDDYLDRHGEPRTVRGKLAFAMVESYQNIVRHRVPDGAVNKGGGRSMFLLRSAPGVHEVTAVNAVTKNDEEQLRTALDRLVQLDGQQMKQIFLQGLQSEVRTDRGGAGLGLIEMTRRSGNPLRHAFAPLDEAHTLFALQVLVSETGAWRSAEAEVLELHRLMVEGHVDLICRGDLPPSTQENLLRMIERDLDDDQARADRAKHAFLLMMGAVMDMDVRAEGPMVVVAMEAQNTTVTVAVPLNASGADRLEQAVASVNELDAPALQRHYRDILLGRATAGGLELGLMDLARRSIGKLRFHRGTWRDTPFAVVEVDV